MHDGFGRGVIVFGDYTVDLGYGVEYGQNALDGPRVKSTPVTRSWAPKVEVCSDAKYFCLKSTGSVSFAVPRKCQDLKVGDSWTVAGVRTVVLASHDLPGLKGWKGDQPLPAGRPPRYYLLGDPSRPSVVLFYAQRDGVTDLVIGGAATDAARAGTLNPYAPANNTRGSPLRPLVTPDTVAACG
jgi:hypothetical protein